MQIIITSQDLNASLSLYIESLNTFLFAEPRISTTSDLNDNSLNLSQRLYAAEHTHALGRICTPQAILTTTHLYTSHMPTTAPLLGADATEEGHIDYQDKI